jgi:prepilin-type N-terminal cleavage/methylation domain-containing protein
VAFDRVRSRRAHRDDVGFTLIELMASMTLMAIGVVGVIGVMNSSFRVVGTATARSRATAIATRHIESIRAKPYKTIVASTLTSPLPATNFTETVGGQTFQGSETVTLENEMVPAADGTSKQNAYKKAVVWVSWRDVGGYHDIYQTTVVYPGGQGVFNAANSVNQGGVNSTPPLKPKTLLATPVTFTSSVDLVWTPPDVTVGIPPPASWVVQWSRDPSFTSGEVQEIAATIPASLRSLRVDDLADNTTYYFRVFARSVDGVLSQQAATSSNVTTYVSQTTACTVGTASVTPSAVKKRGGSESGKLSVSPQVEVQTLGTCSGTTFEMVYAPNDTSTQTVAMTAATSRTWRASLNGDLNTWSIGEREIVVYSYTAGVKKVRANLRLVVCDNTKTLCP